MVKMHIARGRCSWANSVLVPIKSTPAYRPTKRHDRHERHERPGKTTRLRYRLARLAKPPRARHRVATMNYGQLFARNSALMVICARLSSHSPTAIVCASECCLDERLYDKDFLCIPANPLCSAAHVTYRRKTSENSHTLSQSPPIQHIAPSRRGRKSWP